MPKTKGSPTKTPFLREMLEEIILGDQERFVKWAEENFTTAVKELVKLQPKDMKIEGGDNPIAIIERQIVKAND